MNPISHVCFICDQPAKPINGEGSFSRKSCIFQKLNLEISNDDAANEIEVMCNNCTVILNEIEALHTEVDLLSYLMHRQIKRKYKITSRGPSEVPNVELLNKLDLVAVKSFKLLSNNYVCTKCSFRTPFQDTLVPHFKFHTICEKLQKSETPENYAATCADDMIEYDSNYEEDESDAENIIVADYEELITEDTSNHSANYTEVDLLEPHHTGDFREFICAWCPFKDSDYDNLTQHKIEMHPEGEKKRFSSCHNCGCLLQPNGSCTHQKAIEKGFKPKTCSKCDEEFYMDHLLHDHFRRIHLKCDICGKTFANFKTLRHHEYVHKNGATYKCSDCDKKFKTRSGLMYHLPKHTGNYLYYCNVCSNGFMSAKFLEEHTRIHTKEHKYTCDICGTKFIHNSTYRLHRLWHDNPEPYECPDCGKKFKHSSKLAIHRRRDHTGERPYKCDICEKSFFETTSLRIHQRVHAEVVTYKCHNCKINFSSKLQYIQHNQQIHSRHPNLPKKSTCDYKVVLKPAYRKHHENQTTEPRDIYNADEDFKDRLIEEISSGN